MKQMKEKGKTKSEKVWTSLLFTFSLFTSAALAAEIAVDVDEGQTFAYAIDDGELVLMEVVGPAKVTFAANRNATYSFYGVAEGGTATLIKSFAVTDAGGETVSETGEGEVAADAREVKEIDGSAGAVTVYLTYSGDGWGEAVGGSAAITLALDSGAAKPYATGLTGEGTVMWEQKIGGTYVFTHTTGGKTETATFNVVRFPGEKDNPWKIGAGDAAAVTAYMKDGYLYLDGAGEVMEFGGGGAPWAGLDELLVGFGPLSRAITVPASVAATLPISVAGGTPMPVPPPGAVTSWEALTNAVATVESGAEIAVGADIDEAGGELVVPKGKAVTIRLYGKTVSCGRVTVGGALTVGDAEDSVGRIVASNGAKVAKGGSVTLLGGPMRGTFTTLSPGLILLFR